MEPNQPVVQAPVPEAPKKSSSVWKIVIIVILVLFVLSALAMVALGFLVKSFVTGGGVENFIEEQIEKETGKDADIDLNGADGSFSINTGEGGFQVSTDANGSVTIPVDFAALVPTMPGAVAKSAASANPSADHRTGTWVIFSSSASVDQIKAYYLKEMTARGWVKQSEVTQSGATMLIFSKGEKSLVLNTATSGAVGAETAFQLVLTQD